MNEGQIKHLKDLIQLENGLFTQLNRIHKLTKYAKSEVRDFLDIELSEQDNDLAESRFTSMIEQIEELTKEIKTSYKSLKNK